MPEIGKMTSVKPKCIGYLSTDGALHLALPLGGFVAFTASGMTGAGVLERSDFSTGSWDWAPHFFSRFFLAPGFFMIYNQDWFGDKNVAN